MPAATTTKQHPSDGRIYVCGLTNAKGHGLCHPLQNPASDSDAAGHTPLPRPLQFVNPSPSSSPRFSSVKGEYFMFAALESRPNKGALWCWGKGNTSANTGNATGQQRSSSSSLQPGRAAVCIPNGVLDYDVCAGHVVAIVAEENVRKTMLMIVDGSGSAYPFHPQPPLSPNNPSSAVVAVAASEATIAVLTSEGRVLTTTITESGKTVSSANSPQPPPINTGFVTSNTQTGGDNRWRELILRCPNGTKCDCQVGTPNNAAMCSASQSTAEGGGVNHNNCFANSIALGSLNGAATTRCGRAYVWGDNISGSLGIPAAGCCAAEGGGGKSGATLRHSPDGRPVGFLFPSTREQHAEGGKRGDNAVTAPQPQQRTGCWSAAVHVSCTKAQSNPKRLMRPSPPLFALPGQEGPRVHVTTADGSLWLSGTTHKGLGANCLFKQLCPERDHCCCCGAYAADGGEGKDDDDEAHLVPIPILDGNGSTTVKGSSCGWYRVGDRAYEGRRTYSGPKMPTGAWEIMQRGGGGGGSTTTSASSSTAAIASRPQQKTTPTVMSFAEQMGVADVSLIGSCSIGTTGGATGKPSATPLHTNYLRDVAVKKSFPVHIHSMALSTDGRCFGWGCGSDGRLGLACYFDPKGAKRLMKCYVSTPSAVNANIATDGIGAARKKKAAPSSAAKKEGASAADAVRAAPPTAADRAPSASSPPWPFVVDVCPCRCSTLFIVADPAE